jgi:dipeptidyl aminopeptidase/acylaminoacyl peptidase
VTDLLNLGSSRENPGDGGPPISYVEAFGPDSTNMEKWKQMGRQCSPIYHVHDSLPPTLIYHGDVDNLTPLDQSERYVEAARKLGNVIELEVHKGGDHGWWTMIFDIHDFGAWFDRHLK